MVRRAASIDTAGLRPAAACAKRAQFKTAVAGLTRETHDSRFDAAFFVPGRIEVLGKHTDYAGGRSLLCAAEQGFCLVARRRGDARVRVVDAVNRESCELTLDPDVVPESGRWSNYPATVVRRIARNFPGARAGVDLAFASDLPPAAGVSSSSAFMIAVSLALASVNRLADDPGYQATIRSDDDLAGYLAAVENGSGYGLLAGDRGVGTFGGSEDHTAIICCKPGLLSQYRFSPIELERQVAVPGGFTFVVASSGVAAEKTGAALAAYNRASRSAAHVLNVWREATGRSDATLDAALSSAPDATDQLRRAIENITDAEFPATLLRSRLDQFVTESRHIVPAASDALGAADIARFGALVDRSQHAAESLLGNQVPETIALARLARGCGAAAASAFGAGFGGSVWAMTPAANAGAFVEAWAAAYRKIHPACAERAVFLESFPGPSACQIDRID